MPPIPSHASLTRKAERYRDLDPVATSAYLSVCDAGEHLRYVRDRSMSAAGISHGRLVLLAILDRTPDQPQPASMLAEQAGVTKQTVTALIDGLAGDGLVGRNPHPSDRRSALVNLTAAGRALLQRVLPGLYRTQISAMSRLTAGEQRELIRLVAKMDLEHVLPTTTAD